MDVSDYTTEGVLSMECRNKKWRPVAFLSKSLNETERNYKIHDKEMLAIVRGLENWRHLLEDACFKFKIWMDHKKLGIFYESTKIKLKTSLMGIISVEI